MKYTRSELAQEFDKSVETIKKWAKRYGFKTTVKTINNREVIAYELSEKDLERIKNDLGFETEFETNQKQIETPLNDSSNVTETQYSQAELIDKILEYSNNYNNRIETYIERAVKAEAQQKLIEVSEAGKDAEINRLNALVKEYENKIKILETELELERKKPFWKKGLI